MRGKTLELCYERFLPMSRTDLKTLYYPLKVYPISARL